MSLHMAKALVSSTPLPNAPGVCVHPSPNPLPTFSLPELYPPACNPDPPPTLPAQTVSIHLPSAVHLPLLLSPPCPVTQASGCFAPGLSFPGCNFQIHLSGPCRQTRAARSQRLPGEEFLLWNSSFLLKSRN